MDVLDEAKESKKVVRTLYKNMYEDKGNGALVYINSTISLICNHIDKQMFAAI